MGEVIDFSKYIKKKNSTKFEMNDDFLKKLQAFAVEQGIDGEWISSLQYVSKQTLSLDENRKFEELKNNLIEKTPNEELLIKLLTRVNLLQRYGNYKWVANGIVGKIEGKYNYKVGITISDYKIKYKTIHCDRMTNGTLTMYDNTYTIDSLEKINKSIQYLNPKQENDDYFTSITRQVNTIYNYDNKELYTSIDIRNDNYLLNRSKNIRKLVPTEDRENTKESKKYYRMKNKILYEYYFYLLNRTENLDKNFNKEEYYIGDNIQMDKNEIPKMLFFKRIHYDEFKRLRNKSEKEIKIM